MSEFPGRQGGVVDTAPVRVTMKMQSGAEVDGYVHVRPDGYQARVSDLLNRANFQYLPVTEATLHRPDGSRHHAGCIIVGTSAIELVVCHDEDPEPVAGAIESSTASSDW